MSDKREYILEKAFEVFVAKGYDSASMTVLQKELNMARGAMYRYFESKDDLFRAVIDKYFWGILNSIWVNIDDDISVAERIEEIYKHMKKISKFLDTLEGFETKFLNLTALTIQAIKHYPGFAEKLKYYKNNTKKHWEKALRISINKGEVREDINVKIMAQILSKSFDVGESSTPNKSFSNAVDVSKKMLDYIYLLIRT